VSAPLVSADEDAGAQDLLARERVRVMYALSILAVVFLVPLAMNDFMKGRMVLGTAIVCVVAAFAADGQAIRRRRPPPIPYPVLLVPIAVTIIVSIATQGVIGAFWCYPVVLFFYFVLPRPFARACSVVLLAAATAAVYHYLTMRITVRFVVSLTLTGFIVEAIQDIIGELQRRLVALAITDPLTGAFNRRHMETRLAEAPEVLRRHASPAALLLIDVDHFKRINDSLGHKAGDQVLKGVVSVVRARTRAVDLLFRMGGEEFVVLLPGTTEEQAAGAAEEVRRAIAEATLVDDARVTVSIGVAGLHPGDDVESWLRATDAAMYDAKESGRNRVVERGQMALRT
jgi:diguanylate cyclase (GGDEF)-like protein